MAKQLIVCPVCEARGVKQNMAEVLPSGYIAIARMHHRAYGRDYTLVYGGSFYLRCGRCGTKTFIHSEVNRVEEG